MLAIGIHILILVTMITHVIMVYYGALLEPCISSFKRSDIALLFSKLSKE